VGVRKLAEWMGLVEDGRYSDPKDELSEEQKVVVARARRIEQFLSQNTYTAKQFTGVEGSTVPLKDTIESFQMICNGDVDHIPEQAFYNIGGMDDVMRQYEEIKAQDYTLSVSTYIEQEDTREKIDIVKLNAEIREIVAHEEVLRAEIDKIIAEIEASA